MVTGSSSMTIAERLAWAICATYLPAHGSALPRANEILDWLVFINVQCPECGVPEWPA